MKSTKRQFILGVAVAAGLCGAFIPAGMAQQQNGPYIARQLAEIDKVVAQGPYKANWDSLARQETPEWFKDAKFGIYAHLGVYCVPAYGSEWYPRNMYRSKGGVYDHHVKAYGGPIKFGYKGFIPKFKLARFDPAQWAQLYKDAGAKFAGPVAEHHDGFSMWASKVNRWNAADMGPKRDVAGELLSEIRKRGLRTITSFHHGFNIAGYYPALKGADTSDPNYADLYGYLLLKDRTLPEKRWLVKIKEVIDAYQPDQIWFDFGLGKIPDEYKQKFCAYYYNRAKAWGKSVVITRKSDKYLAKGVGELDIERGRMKDIGKEAWQTDDATAYNSWCWVQGLRVKPAEEIVHELIDIVSKNGVLLLNVCPKSDGTISDDQQQLLHEMGKWLKVNGEAIYATRPWLVYGEGPTTMAKGGGFVKMGKHTAGDIRYTRSKDNKVLYAIALGWPEGKLTLSSVLVTDKADGARIELLGYEKPLEFEVNQARHPVIEVPSLEAGKRPCRYAYAFKLTGFTTEASPQAERK